MIDTVQSLLDALERLVAIGQLTADELRQLDIAVLAPLMTAARILRRHGTDADAARALQQSQTGWERLEVLLRRRTRPEAVQRLQRAIEDLYRLQVGWCWGTNCRGAMDPGIGSGAVGVIAFATLVALAAEGKGKRR